MNKLQNVSVFKKSCFFFSLDGALPSVLLVHDQQRSLPSSVRAQGKRLNWLLKPLTVSRKSAMFAIFKLNIWLKNLLFYDFL